MAAETLEQTTYVNISGLPISIKKEIDRIRSESVERKSFSAQAVVLLSEALEARKRKAGRKA